MTNKKYLVITRQDQKPFRDYSPNSKHTYYAHETTDLQEAKRKVQKYREKGIHAAIYENFLQNIKKKR